MISGFEILYWVIFMILLQKKDQVAQEEEEECCSDCRKKNEELIEKIDLLKNMIETDQLTIKVWKTSSLKYIHPDK